MEGKKEKRIHDLTIPFYIYIYTKNVKNKNKII